MKIQIDDFLVHSFVISIDDNKLETFYRRFQKCSLCTLLPKHFTGFQILNGIYKECGLVKTRDLCNCFISHIALVKMAQALDWDYIGIFEDDACPCIDYREKLQNILQNLPSDIDLLKLGHLGCIGDRHTVDSKFEEVETYGSHAYIVFKKYYNKYIELSQKDLHIDRLAMNASNGTKVYSALPMLFMQEDSGFETLHDNSKYKELLRKQGYLTEFGIEA